MPLAVGPGNVLGVARLRRRAAHSPQWTLAAGLVSLLSYALLEPLHHGTIGPVQLPEPGRRQPNVLVTCSTRSPAWICRCNLAQERIAAIQGNLKLVCREDQEFLFNLAGDPEEETNLLPGEPAPDLRKALDQFARRTVFLDGGGDLAETQVPGPTDETRRVELMPTGAVTWCP